jgi:hypothetical protein
MFINLSRGDSFWVLNSEWCHHDEGQVIDSSSSPEPEEHIIRYCTKTKIKIGISSKGDGHLCPILFQKLNYN